jgi:poly-gamma-glutamate synthesis protein (capsule biosynthesis protein)
MLNGVSARRSPFAAVKPAFHQANAVFANLEVPMTSIGRPTSRKTPSELRARAQFVLRANPAQMHWVKDAGIVAVSLGNNHAMDYGPTALYRELAGLDGFGIKHTGAGRNKLAASSVTVVELQNGIKVGLISGLAFLGSSALGKCTPATDQAPGVNALNFGGRPDDAKIKGWVTSAHKRCDVLIVALHGGIERQTMPTSYQVQLAHAFIDAGADVVWGHHPHVLQGDVMYRGKPILFSMGNLVSPTPAVSGLVTLRFNGTEFDSAGFTPLRISGGRVSPVRGREARTKTYDFYRLCSQTAAKVGGRSLFSSAP